MLEVTKNNKKYLITPEYNWFWKIFEDGSWEPQTFKIFDKFLKKDKAMLDIGAWIGPMAMYASDKCKEVYAFEPDMHAYPFLRSLMNINNIKNVVAYPLAVTDNFDYLKVGMKNSFGDSMTSYLWADKNITAEVPTVPFKNIVNLIMPAFIKIDVEGGEKILLRNCANTLKAYKPTVHLSLHTPWFEGRKKEKYRDVIRKALSHYPRILDENLNETSLEEMLMTDAFNSFVATYEME